MSLGCVLCVCVCVYVCVCVCVPQTARPRCRAAAGPRPGTPPCCTPAPVTSPSRPRHVPVTSRSLSGHVPRRVPTTASCHLPVSHYVPTTSPGRAPFHALPSAELGEKGRRSVRAGWGGKRKGREMGGKGGGGEAGTARVRGVARGGGGGERGGWGATARSLGKPRVTSRRVPDTSPSRPHPVTSPSGPRQVPDTSPPRGRRRGAWRRWC